MLNNPSRLIGQSTVIMPTRPRFCMAITSMPKDAVVAKSTVAFAVTLPLVGQIQGLGGCYDLGKQLDMSYCMRD